MWKKDYIFLGIFLTLFLVFTLAFFYVRSSLHALGYYNSIYLAAAAYAILIAVASSYFGFKYCRFQAERYYLGYLYNLGCFVVFIFTWTVWIKAGLSTPGDSYNYILIAASIWGAIILINTLSILKGRRNIIKGMRKDEIFE